VSSTKRELNRNMNVLVDSQWIEVRDGDERVRGIYLRHYSARKNGATTKGAPNWKRICGPGEHLILLSPVCDALFVWVRQNYRLDGQKGVNCAVFRNEGVNLSSELIREACRLAWVRWPNERLFTYVNPQKIKSTNPGFCFLQAGWRRVDGLKSRRGYILLELEAGIEKCQKHQNGT